MRAGGNKTDWDTVPSHCHEDPLGDRLHVYFHRDMGQTFDHSVSPECLCGPIRTLLGDRSQIEVYKELDLTSQRMVN